MEVRFLQASHVASGNPSFNATHTTGRPNVRLSYIELSITSIRYITLRSATGATPGKPRGTCTNTKHLRPVWTEACFYFVAGNILIMLFICTSGIISDVFCIDFIKLLYWTKLNVLWLINKMDNFNDAGSLNQQYLPNFMHTLLYICQKTWMLQ